MHSLRYSAPPDVYLDNQPSSPDTKSPLRRVQTASSFDVLYGKDSSDSGDESFPGKQDVSPLSPQSSRLGNDNIKKTSCILQKSVKSSAQGLNSPNGHGSKIPTINITSFHSQSSYVSSDNDSEFEDADMKKELQNLREKYVSVLSKQRVFFVHMCLSSLSKYTLTSFVICSFLLKVFISSCFMHLMYNILSMFLFSFC